MDSDDLILTPPYELARRCKVSLLDIQTIVDAVCAASLQTLSPLHSLAGQHTKFSTGDPGLDDALGGGMQTGSELYGQGLDALEPRMRRRGHDGNGPPHPRRLPTTTRRNVIQCDVQGESRIREEREDCFCVDC